MDTLNDKDKENNEIINSLGKEKNSGYSLNEIKENIKTETTFKRNFKKTMVKHKDINSLLGGEQKVNKFLFEDGNKSDDEENIQEQNDIMKMVGRQPIGKLINDEIEQDELYEENNSEKYNDIAEVVEKWKYEKILLDNNIIDYNCK